MTNDELIERLRSVAGFDHLPRTDLAVLAADALEASEARVKELEARVKDFKCGQVFRISEMQELVEAQHRIAELEAMLATRQPSEDDREALRIAVGRVVRDVMNFPQAVQARLLGQDMSPLRDALVDSVLAAGFSRAAAPDAATEELAKIKPLFENLSREYPNECNKRVKAEAERDAALAVIERVAALHIESDWKCGNPRHTNPEIGCPECYTECETCDRTYPCDTRVALDGAPEPEWDLDEQWEGGQPNGLGEIEPTTERDWFTPERETHRRKVISLTGPWLPVEGEKP